MKVQLRFLPSLLLPLSLLLTGCDESASTRQWELAVYNPATQQTSTVSAVNISPKLLVINYWAEWCKPCIEEMPELSRFAQAEQSRVVVYGVNFDNKQGAVLQDAMRKVGMVFPAIVSDPASVFTLPEINGLPTTLILDEHGVLKQQLLGPQTYDSLLGAVNRGTQTP